LHGFPIDDAAVADLRAELHAERDDFASTSTYP
jgi:hypothetical protein